MPPEGENKTPSQPSGSAGGGREVIFEFIPLGGSVKASAIDVLTGIEVSVVGPATLASRGELQRIALTKLKQRLAREDTQSSKPDMPPRGVSGGGIIV
ncbi:MAG: hypothetical protein WA138_07915 [Parvibaculum sp.]